MMSSPKMRARSTDTVDFSSATIDLTFTIANFTVVGGANKLTYNAQIENMIASAGNDTFVFGVGVTFTGTLDGKGGNDTLNFSAYTTSLNFTLTALGNVDGFNGTVNAIIGIFTNINAIIGGTGTDTLMV